MLNVRFGARNETRRVRVFKCLITCGAYGRGVWWDRRRWCFALGHSPSRQVTGVPLPLSSSAITDLPLALALSRGSCSSVRSS